MAYQINTVNFGSVSAGKITPAELYGKVSKSLLSQNASVQKLTAQLTQDQTKLSGLGQLQSALGNFQSLTQSLSGVGLQTGATASTPGVLSAVTNASAKPGSYEVNVQQLAQAQLLTSRPQKSADAVIGNGAATTIKIETGTQSGQNFAPGAAAKTITIDSSNNSLAGIAAALKSAGVEATVVKGANGFSLQMAGQSGAASSMRISVAGDPALQQMLSYVPGGLKGMSETTSAQNALLTIDGKATASATNVVTGSITGVALSLSTIGSSKVTVAQESGAIAKNIGNFVSSFNSLTDKLKTLQKGDLRSDPALAQAQEQLAELITRNQEGLAKAGITLDKNGALQIDAKALQEAVTADAGAVTKLFTGEGKGVADQLDAKLAQMLGSGGSISQRKTALDRDMTALTGQKATLTKQVTSQADALVARYAQISGGNYSGSTTGTSVTGGTAAGAISALPGLPGGGETSLFDFLA